MKKPGFRSFASRKSMCIPRRKSMRLGNYLAAGVTGAILVVPTAQAQIVNIDLGPSGFNLLGTNAGVASGYYNTVANFPVSGTNLYLLSFNRARGSQKLIGVSGDGPSGNLEFAVGGNLADPRKFAHGNIISASGIDFTNNYLPSLFYINYNGVPSSQYDWVNDSTTKSYLGFRFTTNGTGWNYGWLQASWSQSSQNFELLAAAYESQINTSIKAGEVQAIPEPSSMVLAGISGLALGAGAIRRARKLRKEKVNAEIEPN